MLSVTCIYILNPDFLSLHSSISNETKPSASSVISNFAKTPDVRVITNAGRNGDVSCLKRVGTYDLVLLPRSLQVQVQIFTIAGTREAK